jgi:hypothetical protein
MGQCRGGMEGEPLMGGESANKEVRSPLHRSKAELLAEHDKTHELVKWGSPISDARRERLFLEVLIDMRLAFQDFQMEQGEFEKELAALLNKHSAENSSDTPDFILATFFYDCLKAWNLACRRRDNWFHFHPFETAKTKAEQCDPKKNC